MGMAVPLGDRPRGPSGWIIHEDEAEQEVGGENAGETRHRGRQAEVATDPGGVALRSGARGEAEARCGSEGWLQEFEGNGTVEAAWSEE